MSSMIAALIALATSSLRLEAPASGCPDAALVRASLEDLGVEVREREGVARWTAAASDGSARERVTLYVESRTASVAITERELPSGPCEEVAEALALAIERATAPLGAPRPARKSVRRGAGESGEGRAAGGAAPIFGGDLARAEPPEPWDLEAYGGPALLLSSRTSFAFTAGTTLWPEGGALGLTFGAGFALPQSSSTRAATSGATIELWRMWRAWISGGAAARWRVTEDLRLGASAMLLIDYAHGDPENLRDQAPARDVRIGFTGGPWALLRLGAFGLRASGELRLLSRERTYTARPATELANLPIAEALVVLSFGYVKE